MSVLPQLDDLVRLTDSTVPHVDSGAVSVGVPCSVKSSPGIGMPASLYLDDFGQLLLEAFGAISYHVGSSMPGSGRPSWRDVDVRLILSDERYAADGFGDPERPHDNLKWCAMVKAFSLLGQKMTGLPIDFQIQQVTWANRKYGSDQPAHHRSALFSMARSQQNHVTFERGFKVGKESVTT